LAGSPSFDDVDPGADQVMYRGDVERQLSACATGSRRAKTTEVSGVTQKTGCAAVWTGSHSIQLMQLPIPAAEEGGAVIKVDATAICGTDGSLFPLVPPYPVIMGHEVTGTIVDLGPRASDCLHVFGGPLRLGDRVALYPWVLCGNCPSCLELGSDMNSVCERSFCYGAPIEVFGLGLREGLNSDANTYPHFKGGFAEYLYVFPGTYLWKVPDDMPSEIAALLDPMAVAVRAVELACKCPGVPEESFTTSSTILIIGDGPIGALCAWVSRIMGVEQIVIIGGRDPRLEIAQGLSGADHVMNYRSTSLEDRIRSIKDLTGGRGADVVFQCSNRAEAFVQGLEMMRRLGTLVEVGNAGELGNDVSINVGRHVCGKHATIVGLTANTSRTFNKAFHLLMRHKQHDFMRLFTHVCSLESLEATLNSMKDEDYFKGILKP
jgi:threonine dehydrogenase-like Zn-dependent dehydrogenase